MTIDAQGSTHQAAGAVGAGEFTTKHYSQPIDRLSLSGTFEL